MVLARLDGDYSRVPEQAKRTDGPWGKPLHTGLNTVGDVQKLFHTTEEVIQAYGAERFFSFSSDGVKLAALYTALKVLDIQAGKRQLYRALHDGRFISSSSEGGGVLSVYHDLSRFNARKIMLTPSEGKQERASEKAKELLLESAAQYEKRLRQSGQAMQVINARSAGTIYGTELVAYTLPGPNSMHGRMLMGRVRDSSVQYRNKPLLADRISEARQAFEQRRSALNMRIKRFF